MSEDRYTIKVLLRDGRWIIHGGMTADDLEQVQPILDGFASPACNTITLNDPATGERTVIRADEITLIRTCLERPDAP